MDFCDTQKNEFVCSLTCELLDPFGEWKEQVTPRLMLICWKWSLQGDMGGTGQDAQDQPCETLHCVQKPDLCGQEWGCRADWVTSAHHFLRSGEGFPALKWGGWGKYKGLTS